MLSEGMPKTNQPLPRLAASLKRRLDRDVELMEERHQAILADVEPALESAGVGVSWLKQRLTEKVKHVKRGHAEIMTRLGIITASIDAETIEGAGEASLHHNQPCVRDTCEYMGHNIANTTGSAVDGAKTRGTTAMAQHAKACDKPLLWWRRQ